MNFKDALLLSLTIICSISATSADSINGCGGFVAVKNTTLLFFFALFCPYVGAGLFKLQITQKNKKK